MQKNSFQTISLGCKVNQVEIEKIISEMVSNGYCYEKDKAEIAIINTCTVTHKADKKSLATIKKISNSKDTKAVFITGCYSQLEKDLIKKINPEKNFIISQKEKNNIPKIIQKFSQKQKINNHEIKDEKPVLIHKQARNTKSSLNNYQQDFFQHTRAFVKIQDGCNAFCSYCRIPYARGGAVSREKSDILNQVKQIILSDSKEIVLTGINIGTYRDRETRANFGHLVEEILTSMQGRNIKLRISSIEPFSIDDDFLALLKKTRLVKHLTPHIHIALQGTTDHVLKEMNRRYTTEEFYNLLKYFYDANPLFAISTDIITAHPSESKEDFEKGLDFVKQCRFNKIHVFPFSKRPLTSDFDKQNLWNGLEKKRRVQEIMKISDWGQQSQIEDLKNKQQRFIIEEKISFNDFTKSSEMLFFSEVGKDFEHQFIQQNNNEKIAKENFKNYSKNYSFFKGTTDYYLKGFLITKNKSLKKGDALETLLGKF